MLHTVVVFCTQRKKFEAVAHGTTNPWGLDFDENGQTFIIVTHDPEVGAKCDRIIHMRDGRIVTTDGNVDHIADEINQLG